MAGERDARIYTSRGIGTYCTLSGQIGLNITVLGKGTERIMLIKKDTMLEPWNAGVSRGGLDVESRIYGRGCT